MGIFIYLAISKSVTSHEWEKVYAETLKCIEAFPLAEIKKVSIQGIETICLVRTEETRNTDGEETKSSWSAHGDYVTMHSAEKYYLSNKTIGDKWEPNAGDAMLGILPVYFNYNPEEPRFNHIYDIWGAKTQGEPYHIYLLAIACLIEARLGEKAFIYGEITRGQCRRAVEIVNEQLDIPIDMPARCDIERFFKRVSKLPLSDEEKLRVFTELFLGNQDSDFRKRVRMLFSAEAFRKYWEKCFHQYSVGSYGFNDVLHKYLLWGFDLDTLCDLVDCEGENSDSQYEKFVKSIMDTKLYVVEKDCTDVLDIDMEEEQPYSIATLFAQFMFAGARNKNVERYIPLSEIKSTLRSKLAGKCDVEKIIDDYLNDEKRLHDMAENEENLTEQERDEVTINNASHIFNSYVNAGTEKMKRDYENYDISDYEDLIFYEKGDTIRPGIEDNLKEIFDFYHGLLEEEHYKTLLAGAPHRRCEWLVEQNRSLLLRDKDWEKIFIDIEENQESFARYYPMVRVQLNSDGIAAIIKGLVINDDLYRYCVESGK